LTPGRRSGDDPLDVRQETHIQHAVRFIENQRVRATEARWIKAQMIQKSAGRSNAHVVIVILR
jgi:hypothetical protein